jgi:hypothetical protein
VQISHDAEITAFGLSNGIIKLLNSASGNLMKEITTYSTSNISDLYFQMTTKSLLLLLTMSMVNTQQNPLIETLARC